MRGSEVIGWLGLVGLGLAGCDSGFSTRCLIPVGGDVCFDGIELEPDGSVDDVDGGVEDVDASSAVDGGADAGMDASGVEEDGGAPSIARFCELQFATARAFSNSCNCTDAADRERIEQFVEDVLRYRGTSDCIAGYAQISATTRYEPAAATACAQAFDAQFALPQGTSGCTAGGIDIQSLEAVVGKGAQNLAQLPACRAAFVGSVARDQACASSLECAGGLRCLPMPGQPVDAVGGPRTCQPARGEVDPCATNSDCADGLVCAGTRSPGRICIGTGANQLRPQGATCEAPLECAHDTVCSSSLCTPNTVEVVCEQ